jgi:hypothetical protein
LWDESISNDYNNIVEKNISRHVGCIGISVNEKVLNQKVGDETRKKNIETFNNNLNIGEIVLLAFVDVNSISTNNEL